MTRGQRVFRKVLTGLGYLGTANVALLFLVGGMFGDAVNGKVENGHYYLGKHGNGPYLEVSRALYNLSLWHVVSAVATVVLMAVAYLLAKLDWTDFPWLKAVMEPDEKRPRA